VEWEEGQQDSAWLLAQERAMLLAQGGRMTWASAVLPHVPQRHHLHLLLSGHTAACMV
jgi:hypothetical protein